jgi:hypothetical protein
MKHIELKKLKKILISNAFVILIIPVIFVIFMLFNNKKETTDVVEGYGPRGGKFGVGGRIAAAAFRQRQQIERAAKEMEMKAMEIKNREKEMEMEMEMKMIEKAKAKADEMKAGMKAGSRKVNPGVPRGMEMVARGMNAGGMKARGMEMVARGMEMVENGADSDECAVSCIPRGEKLPYCEDESDNSDNSKIKDVSKISSQKKTCMKGTVGDGWHKSAKPLKNTGPPPWENCVCSNGTKYVKHQTKNIWKCEKPSAPPAVATGRSRTMAGDLMMNIEDRLGFY